MVSCRPNVWGFKIESRASLFITSPWTSLISQLLQWFSLWYVYRYQPISHTFCTLNCNVWQLCVTWSCEKIQTLFIFLCDIGKYSTCPMNKVWAFMSAVFPNIALKWTPFAYLIKHMVFLLNPFSAGIDFRGQNLTSVDVRFKSDAWSWSPHCKIKNIYNGRWPITWVFKWSGKRQLRHL